MEQATTKEMNQVVDNMAAKLLKGEQYFIRKILKNRKLFLVFIYAGTGAAAILLILYTGT